MNTTPLATPSVAASAPVQLAAVAKHQSPDLSAPAHELLTFQKEFAPPRTPSRFPGRTDQHVVTTIGPALAVFAADQLDKARALAASLSDGKLGAKAVVLIDQAADAGPSGIQVFDTIDIVTSKYWRDGKPDAGFGTPHLASVHAISIPADHTLIDRPWAKLIALVDGPKSVTP